MQTTNDRNNGTATSPNATDQHRESGGVTTELARHYGEHGHPATAGAGPAAQDSAAQPAVTHGSAAARYTGHHAGEGAGSAVTKAGETAKDIATRAREHAAPAAQAVYDRGARAGQYVTRNVHDYPVTALLIAAAVGYGLAYLLHGGSRREVRNLYDQRTN